MFHDPLLQNLQLCHRQRQLHRQSLSQLLHLLVLVQLFQQEEQFRLLIVLRFHRILVMLRSYQQLRESLLAYVVQHGLLVLLE